MSTLARRDATVGSDAPPVPAPAVAPVSASPAALLVPLGLGIAIVSLAFSGGGFFAGATGVATAVTAAALAAWLVLVKRPLAGLSPALGIAIAGFTAFAVWVLLSSRWSHAATRALLEGDRALLYALVVALVGLAAADRRVRAFLPRLVAAALVVIAVAGLVTRLLPHVWPIASDVEFERLSYPLGYWNGEGALGSLAIVACVHLAGDLRERLVVRALATAALPLLATAVALTFSRGAIAAGLIGVVAYLLLARPRGAVCALLAAALPALVAVGATLRSDSIVEQPQVSAAGVHAGAQAMALVAVCALLAGAALLVLARTLEPRVRRWSPPPIPHARLLLGVGLGVVLAAGIAADGPALVGEKLERLTHSSHVQETANTRDRLTQLSDNGRIDAWQVSLDGFSSSPLQGTGAGTFALEWNARRPDIQDLNDGHSLIFETLGELGVVGLALLVTALGALLIGSGLAARRSATAAVGFAVLLTWTIHAAIDWDWELPALTIPALALAAAAVAHPRTAATAAEASSARGGALMRAGAVVALGSVAALAVGIAWSQHLLGESVTAMRANDCTEAVSSARRAVSIDAQRPEPHQVLAVCALRAADPTTALAQARIAQSHDPANWRMAYDVAMVQAIAGQDPRPMMREARRLNPRSWLLIQAQDRFRYTPRADWPTVAQRAGLLV
jgi:hypothetical protein